MVGFFAKAAGICRTYKKQFHNMVNNLGITVYHTFRPLCHAVGALYVGSDLAHLEVLRVSNATDQFLQFLAEQIDFFEFRSSLPSKTRNLGVFQIGGSFS